MLNKRRVLGIAILAGIIAAAAGLKIYTHYLFASEVDDWVKDIPGLTVCEKTSSLFKDQVILRDVRLEAIASTPLRANEVVIYSDKGSPERPERRHLAVKGFSAELNDVTDQGAVLRALGIDRLQGDLEIDVEMSPDLKELLFHLVRISFDGFGAVELSSHLYDMDLHGYDLMMLRNFEPLPADDLRIGYLRFAYRDLSLVARFLENQPLQPEMMVQMALASSPRLQHISGFREAALAFLTKPARLEFVIAPEQPMRLADMKTAAAQEPERLHMRLKYEE